MEDIYLNTQKPLQLIHFLSEWVSFAKPELRKKAEAYIESYDQGEEVDRVELAEFVRDFAREIYPIRFALDRFFSEEGALIEWDHVEKSVLRSTAHLMHQFQKGTSVHSIDELLEHEDFEMTFGDNERSEILQVRHHVREDFIKEHPQTLAPLMDEGERVRNMFEEEIKKMRNVASGLPTLLQEELYSKITRFEDRVYYQGEHIPLQILEEELAYYTDQKEIPIS